MFGGSSVEKAARKAEKAQMFAREREATRLRNLRYRIEEHGYRLDDGLGYGVTIEDGIVTVGTPELASTSGPLAGAHASVESLAPAGPGTGQVAAMGMPAFAGRRSRAFLLIRGAGFEAVNPVDASDPDHLLRWIAWFNTQAMAAENSPH
jgi:hypothetical protein